MASKNTGHAQHTVTSHDVRQMRSYQSQQQQRQDAVSYDDKVMWNERPTIMSRPNTQVRHRLYSCHYLCTSLVDEQATLSLLSTTVESSDTIGLDWSVAVYITFYIDT